MLNKSYNIAIRIVSTNAVQKILVSVVKMDTRLKAVKQLQLSNHLYDTLVTVSVRRAAQHDVDALCCVLK